MGRIRENSMSAVWGIFGSPSPQVSFRLCILCSNCRTAFLLPSPTLLSVFLFSLSPASRGFHSLLPFLLHICSLQMSCKLLKTIENLEINVKTGPCEAVWCVPRRNTRQVSFLKVGFAEWKCHIHNHFHVVELLLPTTKITEHLLKNVGLVLLKSSRLHSLQEVLGPSHVKTWVQLLWYHKCIKSKGMLSPAWVSHWTPFRASLSELPQGARRAYMCAGGGFVLGQGNWEGKGDPSASRILSSLTGTLLEISWKNSYK